RSDGRWNRRLQGGGLSFASEVAGEGLELLGGADNADGFSAVPLRVSAGSSDKLLPDERGVVRRVVGEACRAVVEIRGAASAAEVELAMQMLDTVLGSGQGWQETRARHLELYRANPEL